MKDKSVEKRVKSKQTKLKKLFKDIEENKQNLVESLIYNASFMSVKLEDLINYISDNGIKDEYKNGENQFGYKESVEMKTYNTIIKNYTNVIKQLTDLLPEKKQKEVEDELDKFNDEVC